jgi:hypothetical protein
MKLPLDPFTLVIMIVAWNIRERDDLCSNNLKKGATSH